MDQVKVPPYKSMPVKKRYVYQLKPDQPNQTITTNSGEKLFICFKTPESMKEKVHSTTTYQLSFCSYSLDVCFRKTS